MEVKFKRIHPFAVVPTRGTAQAAGYDLVSVESHSLRPGHRILVHTGVVVSIPEGHHVEIRSRSGLALKYGVVVLNSPGTVDSDYRGELMVLLYNTGEDVFNINIGDRIAQAVCVRHEEVTWVEEDDIVSDTGRGTSGFGSTGL